MRPDEETTNSKNEEKYFCCYLLVSRSEVPRIKGRTYIGFTVDPVRRIRQHNNGVKSGGARKTNNRGPWDMILFVRGFPNEITALRFEWAWQHPQDSRRLQEFAFKKGQREKQFVYRLRVLSQMLNTCPWNRLSLSICWLREDYRQEFNFDLKQPSHVPVIIGFGRNPKDSVDSPQELSTYSPSNCFCCSVTIELEDQIHCSNTKCGSKFHIDCLARSMLINDKFHIIPVGGDCPSCSTKLLWGVLIRSTTSRLSPHRSQDDNL